jgi:3-methyl-2-oxobutanoate hydroxymethyltransferase
MSKRWTAPTLAAYKAGEGNPPLVMVTAYDAPSARVADASGVDLVLVGDSVAMVVLGYDDTLQVTVADMAHHVAAVARAHPTPFIVGDLPWMSYHTTTVAAVEHAATLVRAGAQSVKLEGGRKRVPMIEAINDAEIPVMGHLGLTPQSTLAMGGFRIQGRDVEAARRLVDDARAVADAGVFAIVLEGIPAALAEKITEVVSVPTIGIGAGAGCDGQVLVYHDVLGLEDRLRPKFVRRYADLGQVAIEALRTFADDVRTYRFPAEAETYAAGADLSAALQVY